MSSKKNKLVHHLATLSMSFGVKEKVLGQCALLTAIDPDQVNLVMDDIGDVSCNFFTSLSKFNTLCHSLFSETPDTTLGILKGSLRFEGESYQKGLTPFQFDKGKWLEQ